jgi:hypothetical protein
MISRTFAWTIALLLFACDAQGELADSQAESASASVSAAIERPQLELAGCRHVEPGRCLLAAGSEAALRVWIDVQAQASVRVQLDGRAASPEWVAVDGGQRLHVSVPAQAEVLRIEGVEPPWTEAFELRFEREQLPAVVAEADAAARAGNIEGGIELLRAALGRLEGTDRLAALQKLRRLLMIADPDDARQQTQAAAELARALGRRRDLADCAAGASVMAVLRGDLVDARRWTQQLEPLAAELPEARVWARYYGGVLASRTGDLNGSVRALQEAQRLARRLDMSRELLTISEQLATALAELGRADEALLVAREILTHVEAPQVSCNDRARARGNVAWINLLLAEAGHAHDPPRPLLEQQLEAVSETGECPKPGHAAFVNLAIVALAEHEPEEAWAWVCAQHAVGVPPYLQLWIDEIEAQVGVASGRDALTPELVARPDPGGAEPGLRWMAIVRHARTLDAQGLSAAAIDAYLEAEAVLEETFHSVGVDVGRELFLAGRRASAEGLVELLVRQGDVEAAFCRARLARGRALRTVDRTARIAGLSPEQRARRDELLYGFLAIRDALASERRDDWQFSAPEREHRERRREERAAEGTRLLDEALRLIGGSGGPFGCEQLPASAAGVVTILQFPRPEGDSWIFVADERGVSVGAAPDPSASEWTERQLEPFADRIAAARQIRILPTGSGWSVPFHALPFAEGVLLDVAPVVYALDLPARELRPASPGSAVVVANPSKDLPHAEREARAVVDRLAALGWRVDDHMQAEASRSQLTDALADASLLHYAGHGTHGGVDGWGAALLLHDGDRLEVSDILALPRVPDAVVLSGCDTATVDLGTVAGGMNLSRAFVLAGARWVVAADGEVDDDLANAMGVALYDGAVPKDGFDGPEALRRAQLRLRSSHPERWQAFRVVVP